MKLQFKNVKSTQNRREAAVPETRDGGLSLSTDF